jgi:hypothetical protein
MWINHFGILLAAVVLGISLAATGILADQRFNSRIRRAMAACGCCVILVGVVAL